MEGFENPTLDGADGSIERRKILNIFEVLNMQNLVSNLKLGVGR